MQLAATIFWSLDVEVKGQRGLHVRYHACKGGTATTGAFPAVPRGCDNDREASPSLRRNAVWIWRERSFLLGECFLLLGEFDSVCGD